MGSRRSGPAAAMLIFQKCVQSFLRVLVHIHALHVTSNVETLDIPLTATIFPLFLATNCRLLRTLFTSQIKVETAGVYYTHRAAMGKLDVLHSTPLGPSSSGLS